ncbi:MAG: iron-sulfur cluster-binding domain-containing protein [Methylococcales bacterium]|jgi:ferredoxin-NADP reductase|nr:iron-sulfur cluster-binding domain-containing protein [Methylococcales bacterium]MBT7410578.1 iron-sulfur cluster-binding domain-containing protein [Methylococcales bacterium]
MIEFSINYQGTTILLLGIMSFFSLLVLFRELSDQMNSQTTNNQPVDDWHTEETLTIVEIIKETSDIKSIRFAREDNKPVPPFAPGQFISFRIGSEDKLLRSYSLSSSTANRSTFTVSIKKLPDGVGSGWFHQRQPGDKVNAFPPSGLFSLDKKHGDHFVFIAGGIGITPFKSMLESLAQQGQFDRRVDLFYGVRGKADLAFHELFIYYNHRLPFFNYYPVLSAANETDEWDGGTGFISLDYIKQQTQLSQSAAFYFCGPPPLTDGIIKALEMDNSFNGTIHFEKFVSGTDLNKIPAIDAKLTVNGEQLDYQGKATLLEFFEDKEVDISYACRVGVCGTCKCKVKQGEVQSETDSGLSDDEKKAGYTLACVSRPRSDLVIEIG